MFLRTHTVESDCRSRLEARRGHGRGRDGWTARPGRRPRRLKQRGGPTGRPAVGAGHAHQDRLDRRRVGGAFIVNAETPGPGGPGGGGRCSLREGFTSERGSSPDQASASDGRLPEGAGTTEDFSAQPPRRFPSASGSLVRISRRRPAGSRVLEASAFHPLLRLRRRSRGVLRRRCARRSPT